MTLLIATSNQDKLREIRGLLAGVPAKILGLRDLPSIPEPEETGATFEENALLKASYYHRALTQPLTTGVERVGCPDPVLTIAEDSGLEIDALDGDPGVRSARFLRDDASYSERFDEIYRRLAERPEAPRTARFVCALAVIHDGVVVFRTVGTVEGEVAPAPRGAGGFGYDPIFWYPRYGATLAEVGEEAKLRVAHRGEAFRALVDWLCTGMQKQRTEP